MSNGIHHIGITVNNFEASKAFYIALLGKLGCGPVMETKGPPHKHAEGRFVMIAGPTLGITLWEAAPEHRAATFDRYRVGLHHIAFSGPSRAAVDELHEALKSMNATILDAPAEYPYVPGYYALFFADPDGVKLEYCHVPG